MVPDAPPPHRLISSTPVSTATASNTLQSYLSASEAHPHLHPDALITPTGVTFSSHGGPAGGVVIHNLRRIAAGLRGEYLEPEATPEPEVEEEGEARKGKGKKKAKEVEVEWVDKEVYEREQGDVEVGEIGDRVNVVAEGGEEDIVGEKRKAEGLSKEERKKAKKERDAKRKKDLERERQAKAEA